MSPASSLNLELTADPADQCGFEPKRLYPSALICEIRGKVWIGLAAKDRPRFMPQPDRLPKLTARKLSSAGVLLCAKRVSQIDVTIVTPIWLGVVWTIRVIRRRV